MSGDDKNRDDGELPQPTREAFNMEIGRLWLIGEDADHVGLSVVVRAGAFVDPAEPRVSAGVWGVAIADFSRHVAAALADLGQDEGLALAELARFFNAEIGRPTTDVRTWRRDNDETHEKGGA